MYKLILPLRYLFTRRLSYLAMLAVALCVFVVVIVITVINGLVDDFRAQNHAFTGDCVVATDSLVGFPGYQEFIDLLNKADFVLAAAPVIKGFCLLTPRLADSSIGLEMLGIDPAPFSRVTAFADSLYYRKSRPVEAFAPLYDPNLTGCVLGIDLVLARDADGRYLYDAAPEPSAFDITALPLAASGALAKAGTSFVTTKTFFYSDVARTGLARVDSATVYLPFADAQVLAGMDTEPKRASAIHIKFRPGANLKDSCTKVADLWQNFRLNMSQTPDSRLLDNVSVRTWLDYRRPYIAAMEKEQAMIIAMFILVGVTTFFVVFVVLYMIISHKTKDIGILKSIGVSNSALAGLFLFFASLLGLLGSTVGAIASWLFLLKINWIEDWLFAHFGFQLWDRTIYVIGDIPNKLDAGNLAIIIFSAILACLIGAFVPIMQAGRLKPVQALQVNQL